MSFSGRVELKLLCLFCNTPVNLEASRYGQSKAQTESSQVRRHEFVNTIRQCCMELMMRGLGQYLEESSYMLVICLLLIVPTTVPVASIFVPENRYFIAIKIRTIPLQNMYILEKFAGD